MPSGQAEALVEELVQEVHAYGPLWPWAFDRDVSEIMVNGPDKVFIEKEGVKIEIPAVFRDADHLRAIIDRLHQLPDGKRRVTRISEVRGTSATGEPEVVDLFRFEADIDATGAMGGWFRCTGGAPAQLRRMRMAVPDLPDDLFAFDPAA